MLASAALGTAIGLTVMFAITALLCSGVTETISNLLQLRARYLITGLRSMLDEPEASAKPGKAAKKKLHNDALEPKKAEAAATELKSSLHDNNAQQPTQLFTLALFDSPLIKSLQTRRVTTGKLRNPQYISSATFVRALMDTLLPDAIDTSQAGRASGSVPQAAAQNPPDAIETSAVTTASGSVLQRLREAANKLPDGSLKRSLQTLIIQSGNDIAKFERSLETWYDEQMARISGWYKRWSRVMLGIVGFIVAILLNIDTFQVGHALFVDAPIRQAVASAADTGALCQGETSSDARDACARQELTKLKATGLPIGYTAGCKPSHPARCWSWSMDSDLHFWDFPLKLLGWIVTAFAVSFGAPFWFDALSKWGSLRNAGNKPATN
jgi:hypothetical protein